MKIYRQHKVKINLFGIGCRIVKGKFDDEIWDKFNVCSKMLETPFKRAIFERDYFKKLKITQYKSWFDLGNIFRVSGLLLDQQSLMR